MKSQKSWRGAVAEKFGPSLRRFFREMLTQWPLIALGWALALVASAAEGGLPWLAGLFIDRLATPNPGLDRFLSGLGLGAGAADWLLPLGMAVSLALNALLVFGGGYAIQYAGQRLTYDLRRRFYDHLLGLDVGFHAQTGSSDPLTRLVHDVNTLANSVYAVKEFVTAAAGSLVLIGLILARHWRLALVTLIILPPVIIALNLLGRLVRRHTHTVRRAESSFLARLRQSLESMRVVRAFGAEGYEREALDLRVEDARKKTLRRELTAAVTGPVIQALGVCGVIAVIAYGVGLVDAGTLSTGMLVEFVGLVALVLKPLRTLGQANANLQKIGASADRLYEVLDRTSAVADPPEPATPPPPRGEVVYEGVGFAYTDRPVIADVSFRAEPGETVALVGPSGAGKSTLLKLLPRLYDPDSGSVSLDGLDLKRWPLAELRSRLAVVPQQPLVFSASVAENLRYGAPEATDDDLRAALEAVGLVDRVERLPGGLAGEVGRDGVSLSGGELQRLAIARALLADPRVLILDEATSSLDAESELAVQRALGRLMAGRTTLVIAHRLSTVRGADRILVLDGGRIIERGDHAALMAAGGLYRSLVERQEGP
jgi:ABC-type multidrug transport system fused ATPase/permease subunit